MRARDGISGGGQQSVTDMVWPAEATMHETNWSPDRGVLAEGGDIMSPVAVGVAVVSEARFAQELSSAGEARCFVGQSCRDWAAEDVVEVAVLLTSELVTNGVVHGHSAVKVEVARSEAALRVAVSDEGAGIPVVVTPSDVDEHGRGLALVRDLSASWGVMAPGVGKTVWFTLACAL
jgi:anti-sigma regulatory factor (Ser/Thr protein kinase)